MNENKITIAINANQTKKGPAMIDGMIALKKIQNYSYCLTDQIGLGFSSHVYRGKNDLNNQTVAIKVIDLKKQDQLSKQFVNEEIAILQTIKTRNPVNLLTLFDVFKTKNNLYIITQFCEGKDVAKLLRKKKKLTEIEAQSILKQLLSAYKELYQLSIVHRDLKLANVFVRKGVVKLADFGFAISSERCLDKFDYNVGSPYYMPPESLKFNRYSFKSDVWSFGIIAFEMVYGKLPWKDKIESLLFQKITNTPVQQLFEPDVQVSEQYKQFILACLQIDYEKRATPQFIINYQWPQARDYVEGVEPEAGYKPMTMVKIPSSNQPIPKTFASSHSIDDDRKQFKIQNQIPMPLIQNKQKSPGNRGEKKIITPFEDQFRQKTIIKENIPLNAKPFQGFADTFNKPVQAQQNTKYTQLCILNQVHYCRFMSNLFDFIEQTSNLPEGYLLKNEIASKILGKFQALMKMTQGENILNIEGFSQYRNTERWLKLKEIIEKFDRQFKTKFQMDYRSEGNQQILINSIKYLKGSIQNNFGLIEQLTYFYQLRDLERRQSLIQFALNSKLQLLCSRKPNNNRSDISSNCQRLNNKLLLLGF